MHKCLNSIQQSKIPINFTLWNSWSKINTKRVYSTIRGESALRMT